MSRLFELYEQLLPTRLYACQKTHTAKPGEVMCRLCNKAPESVAHVLAGCTALAQNKYTTRHNAALKILFFEILQDLGLVDSVSPWYSPLKPKPVYESRKHSRMSLYSRSTKKLIEWIHTLSTTCQSKSSRWR